MIEHVQIEQMLQANDEELRLQGLKGLARLGAQQNLTAVYRALGDASWRVRKEAVAIFLALPGAGSLAAEVVDLLHAEDNAGLRNAAVEILVGLGREAVPFLLEELACNDHDVRKFVLDVLGEIGDDSCTAAMIAALSDNDGNVRAAAAENLGKLRAVEAVPALLEALGTADLLLRFTILEALGQINVPLPVERLLPLQSDRLLRKALFDCLGKLGSDSAIPLLVNGLGDDMNNVRSAAVQALASIARSNPEPVRTAMRALAGSDRATQLAALFDGGAANLRRSVLQLLGWTGDGRFAGRLLQLFDDEELRQDAAAALVGLGVESARALLPLWSGADLRTKSYLAYVFGETGCDEAVTPLAEALTATEPELKVVALHALGRLGRVEQLPQLATALGDESDEVRDAAMQALSRLGSSYPEQVVQILRPLLVAEDGEMRMRVVQVLGRLGGAAVEPVLAFALKDESPLVRRAAVQACEGAMGACRVQTLMLSLTDEDNEVRRLAAEVLGASGDPQALRPLTLALQDEDIWVRAAAVRALGRFRGAEAVEAVEGALRDPVGLVVIAALETLVAIDQEAAQGYLVEALANSDEEVVSAALQLLSQYGVSGWIEGVAEQLLNHRHWEVRCTFARVLVGEWGTRSRPLLEARLLVEGEDLVRQQLRDLLVDIQGMQG